MHDYRIAAARLGSHHDDVRLRRVWKDVLDGQGKASYACSAGVSGGLDGLTRRHRIPASTSWNVFHGPAKSISVAPSYKMTAPLILLVGREIRLLAPCDTECARVLSPVAIKAAAPIKFLRLIRLPFMVHRSLENWKHFTNHNLGSMPT
jgi:hypothetical protein